MDIYAIFKQHALITYRVAVKTKGDDFESIARSGTYIDYTLHGMLSGLIMTGAVTHEDVKACSKYIKIVEKAYHKNHIKAYFSK